MRKWIIITYMTSHKWYHEYSLWTVKKIVVINIRFVSPYRKTKFIHIFVKNDFCPYPTLGKMMIKKVYFPRVHPRKRPFSNLLSHQCLLLGKSTRFLNLWTGCNGSILNAKENGDTCSDCIEKVENIVSKAVEDLPSGSETVPFQL